MKRALLCAPNVSEGRDAETVEAIAGRVRATPGARLLDVNTDPDHNRTVLTYLGEPEAVLEATRAMAEEAFERIDMARHRGEHPRLGAVDVVPFVPVREVTPEEALDACRRFGRWVGERGIPVYYYEDAATRPERRSLPAVRRGGYEDLPRKLASEEGAPDEGPARFDARAGAVVTGVRGPLIAFNVNLRSDDAEVARRIAAAVRHIGGGYRYVRALGIDLRDRGMVQVSMNLVRPAETPLARVLDTVRAEADRYGVAVAGTELIGPVPVEALADVVRHALQAHDFDTGQIVELGLID